MSIHIVDQLIILAYLISVVAVGFMLSRKASENIDSYFLGGNKVPWYVLGVSNASSMFDITGTMWLVLMLFVYGVKAVLIPWLWPVFNQIFLMVYLSIWVRRSNVMTGAEWINTRFGNNRGAQYSRISVLIFALVSVIGFLAYAFQGIGKFSSVFLPFDLSPEMYAVIFMGITTLYVVVGGMYSVVFTDVIQFILLTIVSFIIGYVAFTAVTPVALQAAVPNGWGDLAIGWELDLDWGALLPAAGTQIESDGWNLFTIFLMMIIFKGLLVSLAGPAPNYDMQRILAARTPREASFMSGIVTLCLVPRWLMITGITTLALVFFTPRLMEMGDAIDFELVLPWVIVEFLPVGVVGLLLAGLMAAFMSTFDSTVNSGAAYLVNDIYKRYIRPDAPEKTLIRISYFASFLIVGIGIIFGFMSESINSVTQWIVSGLFGGYTAANVLKWHWWRFNGFGYFWGMIVGITGALFLPLVMTGWSALDIFPIILVLSSAASIGASLMTEADDDETLKNFYASVRPWGFWRPIHNKVVAENPDFLNKANFKRDMVNVTVGTIWQTSLYLVPIYLLIFNYTAMGIAAAIGLVTTVILKKNWYDKLEDDDAMPTSA